MRMTPFHASFVAALLAVQMSGRILTPNGDGKNDSVVFNLTEPPRVSPAPRSMTSGDAG